MIDALIVGKLANKPSERTAQDGRHHFVVARVRVATAAGETLFCSVICFNADAQTRLLALDQDDTLALAGVLKIGIWTDPKSGDARPQLDLVAQRVMSLYEVQHKRQAAKLDDTKEPKEPPRPSSGRPTITRPKRAEAAASSAPAGDRFDDDEPF